VKMTRRVRRGDAAAAQKVADICETAGVYILPGYIYILVRAAGRRLWQSACAQDENGYPVDFGSIRVLKMKIR